VDVHGTPLYTGDMVEYQVAVTNNDAFAHTNVLIGDWILPGTTLVAGSESCSPGATCAVYLDAAGDIPQTRHEQPQDSGGLVIASVGSLASGEMLTLTFRVQVSPDVLAIAGNVAMTESDSQEPLATSSVCPPGGCAIVTGLNIVKTALDLNGAPLVAGEVVEYRIVVTNTSSTDSQANVLISDTVPANTSLVAGSVTCSSGATCIEAGCTITASVGNLAPGGTITLTFRTRVDSCVQVIGENVASVWSSDQGWRETLPVYPPSGSVVLACPADPYEEDDTSAQAVYLQSGIAHSQSHTFCDDSADWNTFSAHAGGIYTITTSSWGPGADTFLTIIDTDGVTVLAVNDNCAGATDGSSCIVWSAPSSGIYYVRTTNREGMIGCGTEYEIWMESWSPLSESIYLPLVTLSYVPADLPQDFLSGSKGKLSLAGGEKRSRFVAEDALQEVSGGLTWISSGSFLLVLVGLPKALTVYDKRK
jgi:uncharacterized repeat protein (TIGR01451 family)